jgi:hypothetical protein
MTDVQQFPFALEPDSVDQWLVTTSLADTIVSASEYHKIIKNLNKAPIDSILRYQIIRKITPSTEKLTKELQQIILEKSSPYDEKTLKLKRLCRHLMKELISAYSSIAKQKDISREILQDIALQTLELIGQHLLLSARMSERPSNSIWKISSQLYQLAQKPLFDSAIADAAKRNILFYLCNPYQLTLSDIDNLYSAISKHAQLIHLQETSPETTSQCYFVWEYANNLAPNIAQQNKNYVSAVFLNPDRLVNLFQSGNFTTQFTAFQQIILQLTGYQKTIHSDIPSEPVICSLYFGFDQIEKALQQNLRKNKLHQLGHDYHVSNTLMDAKLEPLAHEQPFINSGKSDIWQQNLNNRQDKNTVKIQKTLFDNFIIAVSQPQNYCCENIIIIDNRNNQPQLGIIRRILYIHQSNTLRLLIEKIPGNILFSKLDGSIQAILIQDANQLILSAKGNHTDSMLSFESKQVILQKLIEVTDFFIRYQVRIH